MATARKLPSGSWRVRVYLFTDPEGKKHYKSFTAPTKKEAERMALNCSGVSEDRTFEEAAEAYISHRINTLSPRTIEDYKRTSRLYLNGLNRIRVDKVTQRDVQKVIDYWAGELSPKTVANIHSFISAVMRENRPEFALNTSLPQRTKANLNIPGDDDVKRLLRAVQGTSLELPIMLAAFGPMREGEICALRMENINGNTVHVCENMVKKMVDKKTTWVIRHPKTTEGDRYIEYPDFVVKLWANKKDRITDLNPNSLCKLFHRKVTSLGMSFRFHDLRHYSASIQHALGIPDAYIMQRGGWSSDRILKDVYRHTLSDHQKQMADLANTHFTQMYDTTDDTAS